MTQVAAREIQWFAVRMKPNASGGPRTAIVDVEKEQYTNRAGQKAWRKVKGTGNRVFMPEHLVKRAGFEVFLPVKKVWRIKNRFTKEKHLVAVPLLADWMFVGLPIVEDNYGRFVSGWKTLMDLDVIAGVMGTGGKPIPMSGRAMTKAMRKFGGNNISSDVKRRINARTQLQVGEGVKVLEGPFEDFDAKVIEVSGPMVKVMLNLFGRDTPLEISATGLGHPSKVLPYVSNAPNGCER